MTTVSKLDRRIWETQQTLVDPQGDEAFASAVRIDLSETIPAGQENAPLIELLRIGR